MIPGQYFAYARRLYLDGYSVSTGVVMDWWPSHVVVYATSERLGHRSESYRPRAPLQRDTTCVGMSRFSSWKDLRAIAEMQRRFVFTLVHPKAGPQ